MPKGMLRWHLRNKISMYRQHQGLTQADLAKLLKVSATQVARWESDVNRPADAMIQRLAKVLKCRPSDLFPYE